MGKYFGTDGFRGEANGTLTVDQAFKIGRFLGWYYSKEERKCKIVIGKDTRRSSYMFEYAIGAGLTASGADCYLLHVTTTPSVSYVTRLDDFDCGIMISASHNSYEDNGIKLINSNGEKMNDEVLDKIELYLDSDLKALGIEEDDLPLIKGDYIGRIIDFAAGRNRYVGYLISLAAHSYRDVKVGLDCANGSAWMIAKTVFDALGADTYVINAEPNGTNINLNSGSTHIKVLQQFVKDNKLDVGFAYDGDADRCLAVDENGDIITGDNILYIFAKHLKSEGQLTNNTVVTTIMSNLGLYKALDEIHIEYTKTKVGDKYIYENMLQTGNCIGGEQSGHIILSKYATTGDGILTSIMLMEAMLDKKLPLSKLSAPLTLFPQIVKSIRVKDKKAVMTNNKVLQKIDKISKALNTNGRIILRESGTEPVIRVMVEAENDHLCNNYVNTILDLLKHEKLI